MNVSKAAKCKLNLCFSCMLIVFSSVRGSESFYGAPKTLAQSPVEQHGAVHVQGNTIVGQHGNPVFLMGMSLYWSIWGMQKYWTKGVVDWLVSDWMISIIRAPMAVEINEGNWARGYVYNPEGQRALMETVVDAAIANGIYVIVDWHSHHAEDYVANAQDFFTYFGQKYGSYPNIIWEIYNEPSTGDWSVIRNYAEQVIPTIRTYSNNLIICGTSYGCALPNWALNDPGPLTDANTAYASHFYSNQEGQGARDKVTAALNGGLAIFMSEWGETHPDGGVSDKTLYPQYAQIWIDFARANNIGGMCKWSICDSKGSTAVLWGGASTTGGWNPDADLTPSGVWARNIIRAINTEQSSAAFSRNPSPPKIVSAGENHFDGAASAKLHDLRGRKFEPHRQTGAIAPNNARVLILDSSSSDSRGAGRVCKKVLFVR